MFIKRIVLKLKQYFKKMELICLKSSADNVYKCYCCK